MLKRKFLKLIRAEHTIKMINRLLVIRQKSNRCTKNRFISSFFSVCSMASNVLCFSNRNVRWRPLCLAITSVILFVIVTLGSFGLKKSRQDELRHLLKNEPFNLENAVISSDLVRRRSVTRLSRIYYTGEAIMSEIRLISKLIKLEDLPKPQAADTCVIVGSSGKILKFPGMGAKIDGYDYVIRMNFAPTEGFEKFVGSKTSIIVGYFKSVQVAIKQREMPKNTTILYSGMSRNEFEKLRETIAHNSSPKFVAAIEANQIVLYGEYTKFWIQSNLFHDNQRPMTGLITLTLFSHWCPTRPDFVGFNLTPNSTEEAKISYHYYDKTSLKIQFHSPDKEKKGIQRLQSMGKIGRDLFESNTKS